VASCLAHANFGSLHTTDDRVLSLRSIIKKILSTQIYSQSVVLTIRSSPQQSIRAILIFRFSQKNSQFSTFDELENEIKIWLLLEIYSKIVWFDRLWMRFNICLLNNDQFFSFFCKSNREKKILLHQKFAQMNESHSKIF